MSSLYCVVENGRLVVDIGHITPAQIISDHPDGVYTTCRTLHSNAIVALDMHIDRLMAIQRLAPSCYFSPFLTDLFHLDNFKSMVMSCIVLGLTRTLEILGHNHEPNPEFKITMCLAHVLGDSTPWVTGKFMHTPIPKSAHLPWLWQLYRFWLFVELLPCQLYLFPSPHEPVSVDLFVYTRRNPTVKTSKWAKERLNLERSKSKFSNEVLMRNGRGQITEGLSSNFFVIREKKIETSPDFLVLSGTMRSIVLACALRLSIPVLLQSPLIDQRFEWESAGLMSTSRGILVIDRILIHQDGLIETFELPSSQGGDQGEVCPIMTKLVQSYVVEMAQCSTTVPVMNEGVRRKRMGKASQ